ncbi:uncharacterized protein G2W53_030768 [Senna tora]|uniref:Uncharacterized protein n=1 Tax=Senna tora TaxID=362788 RepID=A0A834WH29_9FABA|nr:uncharacterized protein G2W53_030768 [Senna tora]
MIALVIGFRESRSCSFGGFCVGEINLSGKKLQMVDGKRREAMGDEKRRCERKKRETEKQGRKRAKTWPV